MVTTVSVPRGMNDVGQNIDLYSSLYRPNGRRSTSAGQREQPQRGEGMAEVPDITAAVARTLQALRADRGWSLDQLAARSGVSKGVLVALEQGRSNPNLATLARIGDAFGVPVTLLVDLGGEPAVQISSPGASRVLWRGPSGGTGTIIGATDPQWAVELWR